MQGTGYWPSVQRQRPVPGPVGGSLVRSFQRSASLAGSKMQHICLMRHVQAVHVLSAAYSPERPDAPGGHRQVSWGGGERGKYPKSRSM